MTAHVVGLVAKVGRHAAVGGDAGASARASGRSPRAGSRRSPGRRASARAPGTCRRTCWPPRSTRSGCSRAGARPARGRGRDHVPARCPRQARRRAPARAPLRVQERGRPDHPDRAHARAPRVARPAQRVAPRPKPSTAIAERPADAPAEVRELVDTGRARRPRRAGRAGRPARLPRRGVRRGPARRVGDAHAAVRRPMARRPAARAFPGRPQAAHVALVEVRGGDRDGRAGAARWAARSGSDSVGGGPAAAAEDEQARAVVLHVDSPGGSAVASDTIWREVCRVRDAGKPVVVSMGAATPPRAATTSPARPT